MPPLRMALTLTCCVVVASCSSISGDPARHSAPQQTGGLKLSKAVVSNPLGADVKELASARGVLSPLARLAAGSELYLMHPDVPASRWWPLAGTDATQLVNLDDLDIVSSTSLAPGYLGSVRDCPGYDFDAYTGRLQPVTHFSPNTEISIFGRDEAYLFNGASSYSISWIPKHCLSNAIPALTNKTIAIIHFGIPPGRTGGVEVNLEQHACELVQLGARVKFVGGVGGGNVQDCLGGNAVSETIRPEYSTAFPGEDAAAIKDSLIAFRDGKTETLPDSFRGQIAHVQELLKEDLEEVDYVIVHNVHSIPFIDNIAFPIGLQSAIAEWASEATSRRALFVAHDMPSGERTDLIQRLGLTLEEFNAGKRGGPPFDVFATRITDLVDDGSRSHWLKTQIGYGSISENQRDAAAVLYQTNASEISLTPTTGVNPRELQGADGLRSNVGLSGRVIDVLNRRNVLQADAVLVYPARLGVPRKRIELAVKATIAARTKNSAFQNLHLIVTGPWQSGRESHENSIRELRDLICRSGANEFVTLLAYELAKPLACGDTTVPAPVLPEFSEVAALMRLAGGLRNDSLAGFAFMTTEQEGGGMPQVEAVVAGTEVLTTHLDVFDNTLKGISSVHYFSNDADSNRIADTIIAELEKRFTSPATPQPTRSQAASSEIELLIKRYSWEYIVKDLLVPWLLGTRWVVEP
ncbi:MAG: glycosyltransferase [Myxococcales bacterium]|nr:glycosyltransferase [Myxococcales bacterium]